MSCQLIIHEETNAQDGYYFDEAIAKSVLADFRRHYKGHWYIIDFDHDPGPNSEGHMWWSKLKQEMLEPFRRG